MNDPAFSVVSAGICVSLLEMLVWFRWKKPWVSRDITAYPSSFSPYLRVLFGVLAGFGFGYALGSVAAAVAGSAIAWLSVLAIETDLANHKIPKEPCWVVFFTGTLAGITGYTMYAAIIAGIALIALGLIPLVLAILTKGGLGSGDVRYLVAVTPLAWWIGVTPLLVAVIVGCIIQIIIRTALVLRKKNVSQLPFGPALATGVILCVSVTTIATSGCETYFSLLSCGY